MQTVTQAGAYLSVIILSRRIGSVKARQRSELSYYRSTRTKVWLEKGQLGERHPPLSVEVFLGNSRIEAISPRK